MGLESILNCSRYCKISRFHHPKAEAEEDWSFSIMWEPDFVCQISKRTCHLEISCLIPVFRTAISQEADLLPSAGGGEVQGGESSHPAPPKTSIPPLSSLHFILTTEKMTVKRWGQPQKIKTMWNVEIGSLSTKQNMGYKKVINLKLLSESLPGKGFKILSLLKEKLLDYYNGISFAVHSVHREQIHSCYWLQVVYVLGMTPENFKHHILKKNVCFIYF